MHTAQVLVGFAKSHFAAFYSVVHPGSPEQLFSELSHSQDCNNANLNCNGAESEHKGWITGK